LSNWSS